MNITKIIQSPSFDIEKSTITFRSTKGDNLLRIELAADSNNYTCTFQRENEACSTVIEPFSCVKSDRTWVILSKNNPKSLENALDTACAFLDYGDRVIISTDAIKNTVEKYENAYQLWHEHPISEQHKFSGYNINCVSCIQLISEAIRSNPQANFNELLEHSEATVKNAEWQDLPALDNTINRFPTEVMPRDLAEIIQKVAEARKVTTGFVATMLLGVLARAAQGSFIDKMPLSLYCLSIAGTGSGKSSIMDYFLEPLKEIQNAQISDYLEQKESQKNENDQEIPEEPTPIFIEQLNFSAQGIIKAINTNDIALLNSEARTVFYSNAFSISENREFTFGILCSLWEAKGASYRTKDISLNARNNAFLNLNLAVQDDVFFDVIAANDSYYKSGFMPRFLAYQAPPKNHDDLSVKTAFADIFPASLSEDSAFERYKKTIQERVQNEEKIQYTTDVELRQQIELLNLRYAMLKATNNANHATYRQYNVAGFIDRCSQHCLKIAGVLAVYQNKQKITVEDLENASKIVDFYLSEAIKQAESSADIGVYSELLNGIYKLKQDDKNVQAPLVSTSLIMQRKILRDSRDKNKSIKRDELFEYLDVLSELGFIKMKKQQNKTLIKLHPQYKP